MEDNAYSAANRVSSLWMGNVYYQSTGWRWGCRRTGCREAGWREAAGVGREVHLGDRALAGGTALVVGTRGGCAHCWAACKQAPLVKSR